MKQTRSALCHMVRSLRISVPLSILWAAYCGRRTVFTPVLRRLALWFADIFPYDPQMEDDRLSFGPSGVMLLVATMSF